MEKQCSKGNKNKHKKNIIVLIIVLALTLIIVISAITIYYVEKTNYKKATNIENMVTVDGKILVIKNKTEKNKIILYNFENNIVNSLIIYEKFEQKEEYEKMKKIYSLTADCNIIKQSDNEQIIEIEKAIDEKESNFTYEDIYNKYLVTFSDIYEIIK